MTDSPVPERTLILLRHAKSAWPEVRDHDRPLAPRGRRAAPAVGRWLGTQGYLPDLVLCSSARRTRETWQLVREQLDAAPRVVLSEDAYGATPDRLRSLIRQVDPACRTLLVIGHDPAVPELARTLPRRGEAAADSLLARMTPKFPTAAVAVMTLTEPWARVQTASANLVHYITPRELRAG